MPRYDQDDVLGLLYDRLEEDDRALAEDLRYKIESISNIVSSASAIDIGSVIDEDLNVQVSLSGLYTIFSASVRSLWNIRSLYSTIGTVIDERARSDIFSQPETWMVLINKSDDLSAFLETNKEFLSKILNKRTQLDPKANPGETLPTHLERRVLRDIMD